MGPSVLVRIPDEISDTDLVAILCSKIGDHGWDDPGTAYERMAAEFVQQGMGYVFIGDSKRQFHQGPAERLLNHHDQQVRR